MGKVKIHLNNDEIFVETCYEGHLAIARWSSSLGDVNIYMQIILPSFTELVVGEELKLLSICILF
jgi:hypothetical protein